MKKLFIGACGNRWVNVDRVGKKERAMVYFPETGDVKQYTIHYWEGMGEFAVAYCRIRGTTEQLMPSVRSIRGEMMVNNANNRSLIQNT